LRVFVFWRGADFLEGRWPLFSRAVAPSAWPRRWKPGQWKKSI